MTVAPSKRLLFVLTRFVIRAWPRFSTVQTRAWALARIVRRVLRHGERAKRRCCVRRLRATALVRGPAAKATKRRCKARVQSSISPKPGKGVAKLACRVQSSSQTPFESGVAAWKRLSIAALPLAIWYIRVKRQRRCRLLCCIACFKTPQAHRIYTYCSSEIQTCFQRYDYVGER